MRILTLILAILLIAVTLIDAFETILLPRRVNRRFRYSRLYYSAAWAFWRRLARKVWRPRWRETMLGIFGPLSMLGLFVSWVASLVAGFATMEWSLGAPLSSSLVESGHAGAAGFANYLYFSGTTFFTLGLGDVTPVAGLTRALTVIEAGLGFGFLAIIIGYLPVLYQAFSRREATISLLDARAGSPPSGGEFLARLAHVDRIDAASPLLREWEHWCAELLESHISFPVLTYYRSQHGNQSWLAALAMMLDASSLLIASLPAEESYQAQLTFAMARHAAVDIALIFAVQPRAPMQDRLPEAAQEKLTALLRQVGNPAGESPESLKKFRAELAELREIYEPFLEALASYFTLYLPPMIATEQAADNWQRSAWMPRTRGIGALPPGKFEGEHFDVSSRKKRS